MSHPNIVKARRLAKLLRQMGKTGKAPTEKMLQRAVRS